MDSLYVDLFIDSGIHWWEECITGKLSHDFRDIQLITRGGAHSFLRVERLKHP